MKCNTCESNFWRKQSKSKFFPSLEISKKINDTLPTIPSTLPVKTLLFSVSYHANHYLRTLPPPKKKQLKPLPSPPYLNTNARGHSPRGKNHSIRDLWLQENGSPFRKSIKERLDSACKTMPPAGFLLIFSKRPEMAAMLPSSLASHEPVEPQGNPALPGTWQLPCNIRCGAGHQQHGWRWKTSPKTVDGGLPIYLFPAPVYATMFCWNPLC